MSPAEIQFRLQHLCRVGESIVADARPAPNVATVNVDLTRAYAWAASADAMLDRFFPSGTGYRTHFQRLFENFRGSRAEFKALLGVFSGAVDDHAAGFAFSYRALIANDLNEDIVAQAESLLQAGYKDAACIVIGVALEIHLKQLCSDNGVAHSKLDKMNSDLAKLGLFNLSMQKQITAWSGRRNDAAHGAFDKNEAADVAAMIEGVRRFMAAG